MRTERKISTVLLLLAAVILLPSCSGTKEVNASSFPPQGGVINDLGGQVLGPGTGESGKPPGGSAIPNDPELLLVTGGNRFSGRSLYFLSSMAREAWPKKFEAGQAYLWNPEPFSKTPRAIAISERRYNDGIAQSVKLLNFVTGNSFTLYLAPDVDHRIFSPSVAPDESWVAFRVVGPKYKEGKILLVQLDSQNVIDVPGEGDSEPRFSPDGKRLSWIRSSKKEWVILSASFNGESVGHPERVATSIPAEPLSNFHASPVDASYFYLKQVGKISRLLLRGSDFDSEISVGGGKLDVHEPSWSPDGKKIIFWSESIDAQSIQVFDLKSKKLEKLKNIFVPSPDNEDCVSKLGESCICPIFSKDMQEVYYTTHLDYWYSIFKISVAPPQTETQMTRAISAPSYYCPRLIKNFKSEP